MHIKKLHPNLQVALIDYCYYLVHHDILLLVCNMARVEKWVIHVNDKKKNINIFKKSFFGKHLFCVKNFSSTAWATAVSTSGRDGRCVNVLCTIWHAFLATNNKNYIRHWTLLSHGFLEVKWFWLIKSIPFMNIATN